MITSQDFRDRYVSSVSLQYAEDPWQDTVVLTIRDAQRQSRAYRIEGVTDFAINEDFRSLAIERCTLIVDSESVYLSLDPYKEDVPSDRDNYYFRGKSIAPA